MRYHVRGKSVLRDNIGDRAYADPWSPTGSHPRSKIKMACVSFRMLMLILQPSRPYLLKIYYSRMFIILH